MERAGWRVGRIVRFWDPHYYRTYLEAAGEAEGLRSVEADVKRGLESESDFLDVPASDPLRARKQSGLSRDGAHDDAAAFVVRDGNYVSARWPGDVNTFAKRFAETINEATASARAS